MVISAWSNDTLVVTGAFRTSLIPYFSGVNFPRSALCLIKLPRHSLSNSLSAILTSVSQALPTKVGTRYGPRTVFSVDPDICHSPFRFLIQNALSSLKNFCFG